MRFCFAKKDFIEQEKQPNKLAVIGSERTVTWAVFEEEVNSLCQTLRKEIPTDYGVPVIIYGHKSHNMVVAIYACMKLKISYIPVDTIYPKERVIKIQRTAEVAFMLNTSNEKIGLENTTEWFFSEGSWSGNFPLNSAYKKADSDPLVYTIFTSGSTGEPKGVMISTEAVQSFTRWMTSADFSFSNDDVFINTAILSFDLSVFELMTFGALGATLLLNSKEVCSDPKALLQRIEKYRGTVWVSTPSFAFTYSRLGEESRMTSVNTFLFCGEVLPHATAKSLIQNFSAAKVLNTYGPTEATVATSIVEITEDILEEHDSLPVGKCRSEAELLIENGEIVIVGDHVSKGYMNNPKLNSEKFTDINGKRAFRTGDEGILEGEMLFFKGRNDDLVKLHGFRIELSEITSTLTDLPYILQAETIALKRNGIVKKIVSIAALTDISGDVLKEQIKTDLANTLPHYMIPADIKIVDSIPLNANGKADKKLLEEIYLKRR